MVDGMSGTDACYYFAGLVGVRPKGLTLKQLAAMANGRIKQRRIDAVQLAGLVWGMSGIDIERFIHFGIIEETGAGGPVQLSPEMAAQVAAEVERLRSSDPTLPKAKGV